MHYDCVMEQTLQVRGVDSDVVAELKARAARSRLSLSAYAARILTEVARRPSPDDIKGRLEALKELGGGAEREDILREVRKIREA